MLFFNKKTDGICAQTTQPSKVQLAVYYEAFDLNVGNYLYKQLATFFNVLEDFVEIELIPYGNTIFLDGSSNSYNCSQGELQCISNKFQVSTYKTIFY